MVINSVPRHQSQDTSSLLTDGPSVSETPSYLKNKHFSFHKAYFHKDKKICFLQLVVHICLPQPRTQNGKEEEEEEEKRGEEQVCCREQRRKRLNDLLLTLQHL